MDSRGAFIGPQVRSLEKETCGWAKKYKEKKCMPISISNCPVRLQDNFKVDQKCLKSYRRQNREQKVFDREIL